MENFEQDMEKLELDFETRLLTTKNVELIESYTKLKAKLAEAFNELGKLIETMHG